MKKLFTILFSLMLGMVADTLAQVHVAPPAVYLDESRTSGRIEVLNSGHRPAEITIDLGYGYPESDSSGNIRMKLFETIPEDAPSATDWIQIYPYQFELQAGMRQTVRFAVFAPDSIAPGEYWSRPIVSARMIPERLTSTDDEVQARLNIVQRSILALNYRQGPVHTQPVMDSLQVRKKSGQLEVQTFLRRKGNAACLGNLKVSVVSLRDRENTRIKSREIAVYRRLSRTIRFPLQELTPGPYRVEVEVNGRREGPHPDAIIPFKPVRRSTVISL